MWYGKISVVLCEETGGLFFFFFFQAEDGIRDSDMWLEFRRVLFRSLFWPARLGFSVFPGSYWIKIWSEVFISDNSYIKIHSVGCSDVRHNVVIYSVLSYTGVVNLTPYKNLLTLSLDGWNSQPLESWTRNALVAVQLKSGYRKIFQATFQLV